MIIMPKKAPTRSNKCGTIGGHRRHFNLNEEQCFLCLEVKTKYDLERKKSIYEKDFNPIIKKREHLGKCYNCVEGIKCCKRDSSLKCRLKTGIFSDKRCECCQVYFNDCIALGYLLSDEERTLDCEENDRKLKANRKRYLQASNPLHGREGDYSERTKALDA